MGRRKGISRARLSVRIAAAALLAASCGSGNATSGALDAPLLPGGITPSARAAFDSASIAFEAGDTGLAHELFAAVLAEDSTLAAAWIGFHLSRSREPGLADRDTALLRARSLIEPPPLPRGRGQARPAT